MIPVAAIRAAFPEAITANVGDAALSAFLASTASEAPETWTRGSVAAPSVAVAPRAPTRTSVVVPERCDSSMTAAAATAANPEIEIWRFSAASRSRPPAAAWVASV